MQLARSRSRAAILISAILVWMATVGSPVRSQDDAPGGASRSRRAGLKAVPFPYTAASIDAATGRDGTLHVAFVDGGKPYYTARKPDGPFTKPELIDVSEPNDARIGIGVGGDLIAALWASGKSYQLALRRPGTNAWWMTALGTITGREEIESADLCVTPAGVVHVVWIDAAAKPEATDAVARPLYLSTSRDGGTSFEPPAPLTLRSPSGPRPPEKAAPRRT